MASTSTPRRRRYAVDKLKGEENYNSWMIELIVSLAVERLEGHVDGTAPKPPVGDALFDQWDMNDRVAKHDIVASLSPDMRELIVGNGWKDTMTAQETMDMIRESLAEVAEATFHTAFVELTTIDASKFADTKQFVKKLHRCWHQIIAVEKNMPERVFVVLALEGFRKHRPDWFSKWTHDAQRGNNITKDELCKWLETRER